MAISRSGNLGVILVRMCGPTSQNTPHLYTLYLGSENCDPFIYLPFKITTYTYTSMGHKIASRKRIISLFIQILVQKDPTFYLERSFQGNRQF